MVHRFSLILCLTLLMLTFSAHAETIFEGYYKVLVGGVHAGYTIQRYDFDNKTKKFTSIYFLKTNSLGGGITESLKAVADAKLNPISYEYTTLSSKETKTINATFKNNRMEASVNNNGKPEHISIKIDKGVFLSTFLVYLMLQAKDGIAPNAKYNYSAIAEEEGKIYNGTAFVKGEEEHNGKKTFRVLNEFKSVKFISLLTDKGDVLYTKMPAQSIEVQYVEQPSLATQNIEVNAKTLKLLFGQVPGGIKKQEQ